MTENERKDMMVLADTIKGEINRMCVTKELAEFDTMYGHAKRNLDKLSKMIYDSKFIAESEAYRAGVKYVVDKLRGRLYYVPKDWKKVNRDNDMVFDIVERALDECAEHAQIGGEE